MLTLCLEMFADALLEERQMGGVCGGSFADAFVVGKCVELFRQVQVANLMRNGYHMWEKQVAFREEEFSWST